MTALEVERPEAARKGAAISEGVSISKGVKGAGAVAALLLLAYALFRAVPHRTRISVLHEDGPVEYLGALSFFLTAAFFFLIFREMSRHRDGHSSRLKPYVALGIAGLFFLAAGEEISWGQRIFGIETPDALREANRQEEINLHNLSFSSFDEYRLFTLGWYPYMIGLPLLALAWATARRLIRRTLPILPMAVWPFSLLYLLNDVIAWVAGRSLLVDGGYDVKLDFPRVELRESLFAVLTALIAYLWWRASKRPSEADGSPSRYASEGAGSGTAVEASR